MLGRLGIRARLAIALVGIAVLALALATALSNRGLDPLVSDAARSRLQRSAEHMSVVVAAVYRDEGGWTPSARTTIFHLAELDDLTVAIEAVNGRRFGPPIAGQDVARASVVVDGLPIGDVVVSRLGDGLLTPEEEHLQHSLDRLHLVAAAVSVVVALVLAFVLANTLSGPLRRIRATAQRIERGDLSARVEPGGDVEIQEVGHALNRLAETLEHEEEIRRSSVADLAHELRTPVSALLSRIEAAQDGVLTDAAANLDAMHAEALRLSRLLDDLSRLADAERPGLLVERHVLDLAALARREAESWEPLFAAKDVVFTSRLEPVAVSGDPHRLGQVISNLLSNALRYTASGGRVDLDVRGEGDAAVLEVADTGVGIAADDLKHVFKRFWRGEKSRSRSTGGAGIGLAIVQELVRAHDGRIDVESRLGEGSTFRVTLRAHGAGALHENDRAASPDLRMSARP